MPYLCGYRHLWKSPLAGTSHPHYIPRLIKTVVGNSIGKAMAKAKVKSKSKTKAKAKVKKVAKVKPKVKPKAKPKAKLKVKPKAKPKAKVKAKAKAKAKVSTKPKAKSKKTVGPKSRAKIKGRTTAMNVTLAPDYRPSQKEKFMNPVMTEYFRHKLTLWRAELLNESNETLMHLQEGGIQEPDIADRASIETDRSLELRTRDRARKLISKIDDALERIEAGAYGYCEETGEPIGLSRLEARPIATLSIEAQERHERMEKTHRDE